MVKEDNVERKSYSCRVCGRKLRKQEYIDIGIGKICLEKEHKKKIENNLFNKGRQE